MSDIDERLMKGPEQPKTATAPTATANPGPPYQLGTNFSSLLRGSNFTESIQNLALVIGTAVVHITLGIPISLALVLKNGVFGLLGLASRPRTPNTICVIGASSGIGRSLAIEYATHGKKLLLIARNETRLDEVATECRKLGADVWTRSVDIADPTSPLESTLKEFHDQYQGIDLLIDVAGIVTLTAGTEISGSDYWTTDKAYRPIFESNTLGMIRAALCAADLMRNRPGKLGGQIAWMSSIEAFQGYPTRGFRRFGRYLLVTMAFAVTRLTFPQTSSTPAPAPPPTPWANPSATSSAATTSSSPPSTPA